MDREVHVGPRREASHALQPRGRGRSSLVSGAAGEHGAAFMPTGSAACVWAWAAHPAQTPLRGGLHAPGRCPPSPGMSCLSQRRLLGRDADGVTGSLTGSHLRLTGSNSRFLGNRAVSPAVGRPPSVHLLPRTSVLTPRPVLNRCGLCCRAVRFFVCGHEVQPVFRSPPSVGFFTSFAVSFRVACALDVTAEKPPLNSRPGTHHVLLRRCSRVSGREACGPLRGQGAVRAAAPRASRRVSPSR